MQQLSPWATPAEPPFSRACELQQEKPPHHNERVAPAQPCQSLCTAVRTQHRGGKKSNGWEAAYKIVIPCFPVVSNTNILFVTNSTRLTMVHCCSSLPGVFSCSIPVDPNSQHLFAFTWNHQQYTWTLMWQGSTETPSYFSQVLHQGLSTLHFPRK